ncbi:MAG TPA: TonB-dependent receptor plug domain-containing protein, partial [bacterium]|nr:TonB-dependent receptor plug domain-containing protein [bacterium]
MFRHLSISPHFRTAALALACLAVFSQRPEAAQQPASEEAFDIGEIVIISARESAAEKILKLPVTTTVIQREKFEDRFTSLPELLAESAGTEVRSYGGLGSFSTVSIRGSESDQVTILIDGVPVNPAAGGSIDISSIPLTNVERIEIYRGAPPVRYPGASIGGVINIVTRPENNTQKAELSLSAGSFGELSQRLSFLAPLNNKSVSFNYGRQTFDGDFKFLDDNGTPFNFADDEWTTRKNNDFSSDDLDLRYTAEPNGSFNAAISAQIFSKDQGVPGIGNFQSDTARLKTDRRMISADFNLRGRDDGGAATNLQISRSFLRTRFRDVFGEIGLGAKNNRNTTVADGARLTIERRKGRHGISVASGVSAESFRPSDTMTNAQSGKSSRRNSTSFAVEDSLRVLRDRLTVIPSYRYEKISSRFSGDDPFDFSPLAPQNTSSEKLSAFNAGARYRVSAALALRMNYGRYF